MDAAKQENFWKSVDGERFLRFLGQEFERRKERNGNYSLRAYASCLKVHASCLSAILRKKRPLTDKLVQRFARQLDISEGDLAQMCRPTSPKQREQVNLALDTFAIISKWYHYAILELVRTEGFRPDLKWIAKALGIGVYEVTQGVERLVRCELLAIDKKGKWTVLEEETRLQANELTTLAMKALQREILGLSAQAVDKYDISERYHGSMSMAIDPADVSEAKERIRQFREELCQDLQARAHLKDVYQLHIGFFPMSQTEKES